MATLTDRERDKRCAAERALEYVTDGMTLGLGTGSTTSIFIEMLGGKVRRGLRIRAVATSERTRKLASEKGINMISFGDVDSLDLTVDGADEIDPQLNLIKGAGGALLHEKIVAAASQKLLIIADAEKEVDLLGAGKVALPVEVLPFGWQLAERWLKKIGAAPSLRRSSAGHPYLTDEENLILDCRFSSLANPAEVGQKIHTVPGVVGHGLFIGMADIAIIGDMGTVRVRQRPADSPRIHF